MGKFNKIFIILVILVVILPTIVLSQGNDEKVDFYFFYGEGCPHCAKEKKLIEKLELEKDNLVVHRYEVWGSKENKN